MNFAKIEQNYLTESSVKDYISLLKPGVMSLVVFSGFTGLFMAPGNLHPFEVIVTIICIALGSGAAGAINMWYDRDIDALMNRTKNRPIPKGVIAPENALEFGCAVAFLSVLMMAVMINYLAAFILLAAILFYVFIYTIWLKRTTPQNIVIGGAAGSFPPVIGWAAVTNNISLESIILFFIIFIWTPPHFWALSLYKSEEYKDVNVPMLPVTNGIISTKFHILIYSILMVLISLLPFAIKMSSLFYLFSSLVIGIIFIYKAAKLFIDDNIRRAPNLFGYSIIYLFLLLSMLMLDRIIANYL